MSRRYSFWTSLSSEPSCFLYSFTVALYNSLATNIIQQKVCSPDYEPSFDFICNSTQLLSETADITTTRSTIRELLPVISLLLAGCWRDATGLNKPILYLSLISEILGVSIELYAAWDWSANPWITSILDAVFNGLLGGSNKLFCVGAMLVITDTSSVEDRTTRLGFYMAAFLLGASVSTGLSGYIMELFGYKWTFVFVIALHLLNILLVVFFIKEKRKKKAEGSAWRTISKLKTVIHSRPNNAVVWLMIFSYCLIGVTISAEGNLFLFYLQQGFNFLLTEAGVYISYVLWIGVISSVVTPLLFKVLKYSDFKIAILCVIPTTITRVGLGFANTELEIILLPWLDFFKIQLFTVAKSVVTKSVKPEEVGVFLCLFSMGECILPLGIFYVYDAIFSATSKTMPGAIFFASAAINIIVGICYSISACIYEKPVDESQKVDENREKDIEKDVIKSCDG